MCREVGLVLVSSDESSCESEETGRETDTETSDRNVEVIERDSESRECDTNVQVEKKRCRIQTESETESDTNVVQMKKKRCYILQSDSESEKKDDHTQSNDTESDSAESIPKPVNKLIDGVKLFGCHMCDFTGKSGGVVHAHLVKVHGYKKMVCTYCKFSTANSTSFHNHVKKYCRRLNAATPGDNTVLPKPVIRNIDGRTHYGCPMCDFTGKSGGVVHAHLVKVHGYKKMVCSYCKFSTGNSTSFHNHLKKYCRQLRK